MADAMRADVAQIAGLLDRLLRVDGVDDHRWTFVLHADPPLRKLRLAPTLQQWPDSFTLHNCEKYEKPRVFCLNFFK